MSLSAEQRRTIAAALSQKPGAVLEQVAERHGVSIADVVDCLPDDEVKIVDGLHFERVMLDLAEWGDVTFIVHTEDLVFEARGAIPRGSMGRGYYNLHGTPIGGHLKANHCRSIAFVSRLLFRNETHSVQFLSLRGNCMFKVYVGRDAGGVMLPSQVERFQALRDSLDGVARDRQTG